MADIPEGSFTHTLEEIDAAVTDVTNATGQAASLSEAITETAETAASGKASIADILGQGTSLVSGTNLDTLYEPGSYYTESKNVSESLVNNPFPANRIKLIVFYLDGSGTSNARCTQIIFPQASTVYFFMRHCISGSWDAWTKFEEEKFGSLGQSLSNSTDVKGLAIGRYYKVSDAQTLINIPSDFTGGSCYIDVYNTIASSNKVIRLYPGSNSTAGCYYETVFSGSSWSSWYKYAGTAVS